MKMKIYELSKEIWFITELLSLLHRSISQREPMKVEVTVITNLEVKLSKLKQELEYAITTYKNENETK